MENIQIHIGKPISNIISSDNVELIAVPEPEEVIRKREFKKRVNKEVTDRIKKEIRNKVEELKKEFEKEKEAEFNRGFIEGQEVGHKNALEIIIPLKESLINAVKNISDYRDRLLKESEKTIVTLALSFAKSIVGADVITRPEIIREQVKKALSYVISEGQLTFHVNPDLVSQFDDKENFIPEKYRDRIAIIPDESISPGGCKLVTNSGTIDATIQTQIAELETTILTGMESDSESDTGKDIE